MPATLKQLEQQLQVVEPRLSETLESFEVSRKINELCDRTANPALANVIDSHAGFWQATLAAHQAAMLMGINALLDEHSTDSATLYSVYREIDALRPGVLPPDLKATLDKVRTKYKKFRHKLFGHNDLKRDRVVKQFNDAGFTWVSLAADLNELDFTFKVLFEAVSGRPIPTRADAERILFPYSEAVKRAAADTERLLMSLAPP